MQALEGRVALVTGAAAGLGRAIVDELAHRGADVALLDIDGERVHAAAHELSAAGRRARAYQLDVADGAAVDAAFDAVVADLGRLDIAVNNAGISRVGVPTQDVTDEDWHASIAVMQTGVFFCMRAAARHLLPQRSGTVVNMGSIRSFAPAPQRLPYCAAKAAVMMMTQVAAAEWAPYGVRVNAVAPGFVRTPMFDADAASGAVDAERLIGRVPAGRLCDPVEVARAVAFLSSDDASFVTGETLTIDGGVTCVVAA